jgi:WD40 repeat protein
MPEQSWLRSFSGYLWGYDFFISYHWSSGGRYAVALAEALRARGHDCFLDRSEFAVGDDWKLEAGVALRRTQRLLVVATTEAISTSDAVKHELEEFRARHRPVFLVVFGKRFDELERAEHRALQLVPADSLSVVETTAAAEGKPSTAALDEIVRSYRVLRRRKLRTRWIAGVICALLALLVVSLFQTKRARDERDVAELQRQHAEDEATGQAGQLLVIKARDGNDEGLLPAAIELAERALASGRPPPSAVTEALAAAVSRPVYRVAVLQGPGSQALPPVFTRAGRVVVSTYDAPPRLFDSRTGALIATMGHTPADAVASDNGERLLTYTNRFANAWDGGTGKRIAHLEGSGSVREAQFSTSMQHIATIHEQLIELVSTADGKLEKTLLQTSGTLLTAYAQGHIASLSDGVLQLWNLDTGTATRSIAVGAGEVKSIHLSPRLGYVALAFADRCELWNLARGARIGGFKIEQQVVFSSDERLVFSDLMGKLQVHASANAQLVLASTSDEVVQDLTPVPGGAYVLTSQALGPATLRDPYTLNALLTLPEAMDSAGAFSQDGRWLLAVGSDHVARIWDVPGGQLVASLRGTDLLLDAAISPDGSRIALASYDGTVELWSVGEGAILTTASPSIGSPKAAGLDHAIFTTDGAYVATGAHDGAIVIFDTRSRKPIAAITAELSRKGLAQRFGGPNRQRLEISNDRLLAFAAFGDGVDVWRIPDGLEHIAIRRDGILSAKFNHDGTQVVTTCTTGEAEIWDARSGARIRGLKHGSSVVEDAVLSTDGKTLATVGDDVVKLWDLRGDASPRVIPHGDVEEVVFSPDGRELLAQGDGITSLWLLSKISTDSIDPTNPPKPVSVVKSVYQVSGASRGLAAQPLTMAFLPQGPRVLTDGYDNRLRLWDVRTGRELATLGGPLVKPNSAVMSRDGKLVATASSDGIARLWDSEGHLFAAFGGHNGGIVAVALSADGQSLVTAGDDATAHIYPVTLHGLLDVACGRVRAGVANGPSPCADHPANLGHLRAAL